MDTLDKGFFPADAENGRVGTLLPLQVDPSMPNRLRGEYSFGGQGDSYYEYLVSFFVLPFRHLRL